MNLNQLYCFREICLSKSMTAAARKCYQSTQNLSRMVKALEDELDATLLVRSPTGVELTESGECLLRHAQMRIHEHENLLKELQLIREKQQRQVHLLSSYGILRLVHPEAILQFKKEHPDISLIYQEFPDLDVEERFDEKIGNVAFVVSPIDSEKYNIIDMASFPLSVIVNEKHPLAGKETVSVRDLEGEPLYLESERFKIHHILKDACKKAGFLPDIVFQTSGFSLCKSVVSRGNGVSVIVDHIYQEMESGNIVKIPLEENLRWNVCMITRKADPLPPAIMEFEKFVLQQLRQHRE